MLGEVSSRRQPSQIERNPSGQDVRLGAWRWFQTRPHEPSEHEPINRVAWPLQQVRIHLRKVTGRGHAHRLHRLIGPMLLIRRTLGHPALQNLLLLGGECFVRVGRWHDLVVIGRNDAGDEFTVLNYAGNNGHGS